MRFLRLAVAAVLCTCGPISIQNAFSDTYPSKPIKMIVPQGAGGSTDILARLVAQKLGEALGQSVVVENRPGAGGIVGVDAAAKSAPDGYTILFGSSTTMAANVSLYSKIPFDPVKDFAPIAMTAAAYFTFIVPPSQPIKNMQELVALAKSKPGQLNFGSGTGSAQICTEMLKSLAGINLTVVPYRSSPQALNDLLAGQLQGLCEPLTTSVPNAKAGKVRMLAVTSAKRTSMAPELPPVADTVPGFEYIAWVAFFAPAGTPKEITQRLSAELVKLLKNPDNIERIKGIGFEPIPGGQEELAAALKTEIARLGKVIREAGIKAD
ncbi:MAG: hypothetical protein AMXMBFR6_05100 [Betaproteobacteria bacterium]